MKRITCILMVLVSFSALGNDLVPYGVDATNNVSFPLATSAQKMSAGTVAASVTMDSTGNFRLTNTYATFAGVYPHGLWGTNGDFWTHNFRGDFSFMDTNAIGRSNNTTAVIAEIYSTATSAVFKVISGSSTNRLDIPTNPAVNPLWNGVAWPPSGGGGSSTQLFLHTFGVANTALSISGGWSDFFSLAGNFVVGANHSYAATNAGCYFPLTVQTTFTNLTAWCSYSTAYPPTTNLVFGIATNGVGDSATFETLQQYGSTYVSSNWPTWTVTYPAGYIISPYCSNVLNSAQATIYPSGSFYGTQ